MTPAQGERALRDVIFVHWTHVPPIDMVKNVKDAHPCPLGPMDTVCPFILSIGHVHWSHFNVHNGPIHQTVFGNSWNLVNIFHWTQSTQ